MRSHEKIMFSQNIFVLGAGSNKPFSFPTGNELKLQILFLIRVIDSFHEKELMYYSPDSGHANMKYASFEDHLKQFNLKEYSTLSINFKDIQIIDELMRTLKIDYSSLRIIEELFVKSQDNSVDSFLQSKLLTKEQRNFLNGLIVFIIRRHEIDNRYVFRTGHWLNYLFNNLLGTNDFNDNLKKIFLKHPPTFLTFNYDRFLEYQLFNFFRLKGFEVQEITNMITNSVFHIYGCLGAFDEAQYEKSEVDTKLLLDDTLISTIRSSTLVSYQNKLPADKSFNKVFFLGFGFDPINCKLVVSELSNKLYETGFYSSNYANDRLINYRLKNIINSYAPQGDLKNKNPIVHKDCEIIISDLVISELVKTK